MTDAFVPPSGPPPPKVPEGWKAQWNEQYREWFYVNIYTKKSQWERPTEPIYPPSDEGAPSGPPPGYSGGGMNSDPTDAKLNPYASGTAQHGSSSNIDEDAALAARLQAEEDARAGNRNAQQDYQNTPMSPGSSGQYQDLPPREQKKGFLGKLLGKASSSSQTPYQQGYAGNHYGGQQQPYGYGGSPAPQQYGGYPPQGYQGYPPQGYGPPPTGYGGGYGYQQRPQRTGMGAGTGAALGLGGGLLGGMMLGEAMDGGDGGGDGGDGGGDMGGGDMGGGDMGGGGL